MTQVTESIKRAPLRLLAATLIAIPLAAPIWSYTDGSTIINLTDTSFANKVPALMSKIAEKYQLSALSDITRGNATSQSLATMGAGTAYASGNYTFIVGGGGGVAVNAVNQTLGDVFTKLGDLSGDGLPRFGIGGQLSAMVGMNLSNLRTPRYLGPLELSRMTVLVNVMSASSNNLTSGLNLSATVAGLHVQYQLTRARGSALQYGEILLTTGFDYSRLAASYDSTSGKGLTPVVVGSGTSGDQLLVWNPTGTMAITSGSGTIPVELSTSTRLLYFLSLYAGGGADFNVGKATTDINLSGTVKGNNGSGENIVGNGTLAVSNSATPQFASARGFVGLQFNLIPGRTGAVVGFFAQASITTLNGLGGQFGVRCAW
ncbi:MAG: hypothetical protein KF713_00745 [Turneriella sp.]|nr:hypothetical protein [Turneriella sp.]